MKRYAVLLLAPVMLAPLALAGCDMLGSSGATIECATTQTECLNQWFEDQNAELLAMSPMKQTSLGLKTDYDKIDDFSTEALLEQAQWWQDTAAEMQANFDYDELSPDAQLSYDMWLFRAAEAARDAEFHEQQYILTQMGGTHAYLPQFLINEHRVDNEADMQAFIARLSGIGTAMEQLLARAQENAAAGTRPPRFAYDGVIEQSGNIISGAPFGDGEPSALWTATEERLAALVESGEITEERADELREAARMALVNDLAPAYQNVIDWFTEDRANVSEQAQGVAALPSGEAYYAAMLAAMTTTDMTADEIHELGLAEVGRIHGEMQAVMDEVGFEGSLQDFFEFMRSDPQFYLPTTEAGAQEYIDTARERLDFIAERLPDYFGTLPKADLEVRRVEAFREQPGAAQHYQPGTPDGSRPGIYYAHLSDMAAMPLNELEVIAYHEGNPGHHMQVQIAQELEGVPSFRTQGDFISAYGEGWALYSEALAKEMGAYEDPYSEFGRLSSELWRAIRLVVDTGIHAKGWSEQQAIDYAMENSPNSLASTTSEVQRYFVLPGQATSYKIGMIRIQQLRAHAEEELGDDFDIRGFHDTVLTGGEVPLDLLERRVENWIAEVRES